MDHQLPFCPVETTLTLIGDKWKVVIIRDLLEGTKRFGELKKTVGKVSQKVLTANLRQMEEMGLVERKVYAQVPPRVEYTLTETGYSLKPILNAMKNWGVEYKKEMGCSLNCEILGDNDDIAYVRSRLVMIDDLATALELMTTVEYETSCSKIILPKENFSQEFFKASRKLAGEIIEKFDEYDVIMAVIGDFAEYDGTAFGDFIKACNNGNSFYFVNTVEEAVEKLK